MAIIRNTSQPTAPRPPKYGQTLKREDRKEPTRRRRLNLGLGLTYITLSLACFIILLPFLWLISASLKNDAQYNADPIQWIPSPVHWSNFVSAFADFHLGTYLWNSVWLAAYAVVVNLLICSLVAYGFARFRFPGRTVLFILLLSTLMFPAQMLTIPIFKIFRDLGWLGTFLPILVPKLFGVGATFEIFLFRQFFLGLSHELDEAAQIDGCSVLGVYWRVILPQARPVMIVAGVFSFLDSWRDAWGPLVYLNSNELRTLPIGLFLFVRNIGTIAYPELMAGTLIALAVPVFLYVLSQRYIDKGVVIASYK